jgi:hypothetical protein
MPQIVRLQKVQHYPLSYISPPNSYHTAPHMNANTRPDLSRGVKNWFTRRALRYLESACSP